MFKVGDIVERIGSDTTRINGVKIGDICEVIEIKYCSFILKRLKDGFTDDYQHSASYLKLVENKTNKKEEIKMNKELTLPKRYIIKKDATVLIWENGEKTIVKRTNEDNFDKRLGFLYAYFQKTSGLSRNKANKYIEELVEEKTKEQIKEEKIMKRINDMIDTLVKQGILEKDTTEILE